MPEAFKNKFSPELVSDLAVKIKHVHPQFEDSAFTDCALHSFSQLELKQRSGQITQALVKFMPADFNLCCEIVSAILHPQSSMDMNLASIEDEGIRGWVIMPVADFIAKRSLPEYFAKGMSIMAILTSRFSAEFAIREFILWDSEQAIEMMTVWTQSKDEHIRRLASEGCRPRLPWGKLLPSLIQDPEPVRAILTALANDESEYVRRSVANNLNDIAKDNPTFVLEFAALHLKNAPNHRVRLLRHACRTLFKKGNPQALALFGYKPYSGSASLSLKSNNVAWNGTVSFDLEIQGHASEPNNLMIDYVVWHQKANGELTPKVFKWKTIPDFKQGAMAFSKSHSFKPVTTRRYYPGHHKIAIQINGNQVASADFSLLPE